MQGGQSEKSIVERDQSRDISVAAKAGVNF